MAEVLCPILVGRDAELASLVERLHRPAGGTTVLLGEAGIGKSRLVRDLARIARERGIPVLSGRAVPSWPPTPYRPLAEALVAACRRGGAPQAAELVPYRAALGRLIPEWHRAERTGRAESAVVLGEGVLRMLHVLGAGAAVLLLVEDLQWADPETLAVLEYLADHAGEERVVCAMTGRPERGRWRDLAQALASRGAASVVELAPLSPADVAEMARRCLAVGSLPEGLEALLERADGLPFLVEELLATATETGALVPDDDSGWCLRSDSVVVPPTFADTIAARMEALGPDGHDVLAAAALLGGRVDAALVGAVLDRAPADVLVALGGCAAVLLLIADAGGYRFRHALTREAVLHTLPAETRTALARRARAEIEALHPGLPGRWCERAAELAIVAGDGDDAAQLLLLAARRALADGALDSATAVLTRAAGLSSSSPVAIEIDEVRVEVAGRAGEVEAAYAVGRRLIERLADPERRGHVHLLLAEAAASAADWARATEQLDGANAVLIDQAALTQIDALAAHVHLGAARLTEAEAAARRALGSAERFDLAEPACRALEVLGRIQRDRDLIAAESTFNRQLQLADAHELPLWVLRATHELGALDMIRANGVERLHRARALAADTGALSTIATIDLQLAASGWLSLDAQLCLEPAQRCQRIARRAHLQLLLAEALLFEAGAHALAGRRAAMERAATEALALGRPELDLRAAAHARYGMFALLREDRARAIVEHDAAVSAVRSAQTVYARSFWYIWALLHAVQDGGDEARAELRALVPRGSPSAEASLGYADAIAAGRHGHPERAAARFAEARALVLVPGLAGQRHLAERLVAECALADGWGEPVPWLVEAAEFFRGSGHTHVERACRSLLRRAGVSLPRRSAAVPQALAGLGISARESDVLELVAAGLTSREIATRLFISARTVDKHVERLLAKTGLSRRVELARYVPGIARDT